MALYRAPRVFEQVFNLENYLDVNALQTFIGYAKLSASNVFERSATFLSEVIVTARMSVTDLNVINTFLGYEVNIFSGIKAPLQSQIDGIIAGGTYTSTISIADTHGICIYPTMVPQKVTPKLPQNQKLPGYR